MSSDAGGQLRPCLLDVPLRAQAARDEERRLRAVGVLPCRIESGGEGAGGLSPGQPETRELQLRARRAGGETYHFFERLLRVGRLAIRHGGEARGVVRAGERGVGFHSLACLRECVRGLAVGEEHARFRDAGLGVARLRLDHLIEDLVRFGFLPASVRQRRAAQARGLYGRRLG